ncbi:MAG: hypothetical protein AB7O48_07870 [Cyclobacteriaceae bacterium]
MRRILQYAGTFLAVLAFVLLESCSSGKGAFRQGDYYQAVVTSANRLRRNDDHKKSVETLRQAYPLGITFYENQVAGASGAFKWRSIYQSYTYLQTMYTEIQTSPGALKVIPNPKNYSAKLEEARQNAAEESYGAGVIALGMGTRDKAKEAHVLFKQVNEYVNGYKDVQQKIQDALWAATVKVLVEPIPAIARTYDVNAEYFDNQFAQQLRAANVNEYVAFLTPGEARTRNIKPDHIVRLGFDEFSIGQTYLKETQIPMERDSLSKEPRPTNQASVLSNEDVKLRPIGNPTTSPLPVKTQPSTPATNPQPATQPSSPTSSDPQPVAQPQPSTPTPSSPQPVTQPQPSNPTPDPQPATQPRPAVTPQPNPTPQPEPKVEQPVQTPQPTQPATPSVPAVTDPKPSQPVTETKPAEADQKKSEDDDNNVVVCHVPPGNSGNRKAMTIPRSALQSHLNHGDYLGECKDESNAVAEQEKAAEDKEAKEKAEKEKLDKEKANKEKAEKEKLEKEKAEKEKLDKEKAEKEKAEKEKAEKEKKKDNKKDNDEFASLSSSGSSLLASNSDEWWRYLVVDTTGTAITYKATVKHFEKTITSNGTLDLKIIDSQNNTVLLQQKMPSEYVWKSEWVTYNGDEEALSAEQKKLSSQREQQPPSKEELFKQFTDPLLNQLITRLKEFYKNY